MCLWEGDNQSEKLKKHAYLISWVPDSGEWDHKVPVKQELQLQIVALSGTRVYLLWCGAGDWDEVMRQPVIFQGKVLADWKVALVFQHCTGYRRLMWNFTVNKSGHGKKKKRVSRNDKACKLLEEGKEEGVMGLHLNPALCFCQGSFRIKLWELPSELSSIIKRWLDRSSCYGFTRLCSE